LGFRGVHRHDLSADNFQRNQFAEKGDRSTIFVDDGSHDTTAAYVHEWQSRMQIRCTVVRQENTGPGGARNHGLDLASGQFVWYVDADDDINPDVVPVLRRLRGRGYDFIDFNVQHVRSDRSAIRPSRGMRAGPLNLPEGEHTAKAVTRLALLRTIGWPWPKILDREFLLHHSVRFPEYCVYEELPSLFSWTEGPLHPEDAIFDDFVARVRSRHAKTIA
jgi:glycosyltransferase involved in cell wall biosynthesis